MARTPLPRYRADVVLVVELGATDVEDADARIARLLDELRPRLAATVRNARIGASTLDHAYALDASAV